MRMYIDSNVVIYTNFRQKSVYQKMKWLKLNEAVQLKSQRTPERSILKQYLVSLLIKAYDVFFI